MIHYDDHVSASNGCAAEGEFVSNPVNVGALGRYVDISEGQVDTDYARALSTLIESEIIPRLMVAHTTATPAVAAESKAVIGAEEIENFAPLVMRVEADALLERVETILARGVAIDTVLVDLLAPTARMLGELWEKERCGFVDVTMGLWRLQEVVHELSQRLPAAQQRTAAEARRPQSVPLPGNRLCAGAIMADATARQDDSSSDKLSAAETVDLLKRVTDEWFGIIGLTVNGDCHNAQSPEGITALRKTSVSRRV